MKEVNILKTRKPSQRSIDIYNQLVKQQNKVRKQLKRFHKRVEEREGVGKLPALQVPKRARSVLMSQLNSEIARKAFWKRYTHAKELFGQGLKSYLSRVIKQGYMELWREQIGTEPLGVAKMFTKEQIENSDMADFMETYNRLNRLSSEVFLAMLYSGEIISFKYIYQEMQGSSGQSYSWLEQQNDLLDTFGKGRKQIALLKELKDAESPITHRQSTISKAEALKERSKR